MRNNKCIINDEAVSPVIGVLLMLVVTIIIAAVVSGFAGGLATTQTKPPVATLDVQLHASENAGAMLPWGSGYYVPTMVIKHMGGDVIATKNTKIKTLFKNQSTNTYVQGELSGIVAVPGKSGWNSYSNSQYCAPLFINDATRYGNYQTVSDVTTGNADWFGNNSATLRPGDILVAPQAYCGNYNDNTTPSNRNVNTGLNNLTGLNCSDPATGFVTGSTMQITILDIPSGKAIFDKEVTIQ
jgi:archaeal type IV pilus assembly protein PilA